MKKAQRWNYALRQYEPCEIPDGAVGYIEDLSQKIPCANCGKEIVAGDGYTSMCIHTMLGFGFIVCNDCYEKEWEERRKWETKIGK